MEDNVPHVTDADVEAIIRKGEAGIADLLAAYEPVERQYYSVVQHAAPVVTSTIDTYPR